MTEESNQKNINQQDINLNNFLTNAIIIKSQIEIFKNRDQTLSRNVLYKYYYEELLKYEKIRFNIKYWTTTVYPAVSFKTLNDIRIFSSKFTEKVQQNVEKIDELIEFLLTNAENMREDKSHRYSMEFKKLKTDRIYYVGFIQRERNKRKNQS